MCDFVDGFSFSLNEVLKDGFITPQETFQRPSSSMILFSSVTLSLGFMLGHHVLNEAVSSEHSSETNDLKVQSWTIATEFCTIILVTIFSETANILIFLVENLCIQNDQIILTSRNRALIQ